MRAFGFMAKVKQAILETGTIFAKGVRSRKLTLSSKSVCIASSKSLANELAKDFKQLGIPIKAAGSAPDLGIDRGSRGAPGKRAAKRSKAAAARLKKIHRWSRGFSARLKGVTRNLATTGAMPQALCDTKVFGLAPFSPQAAAHSSRGSHRW